MDNIFEDAEMQLLPPVNRVNVSAVDIVDDKVEELDFSKASDNSKLPIIDASIMGDDYSASFVQTDNKDVVVDNTNAGTNNLNTNAYMALAEELATKYEVTIPTDAKFESGDDVVNFFSTEIIDKKVKEGIDGRLSAIGPKAKLYMDLKEYIGDDEKTIAVIEDLDYYNSVDDSKLASDTELQKEFISNMLVLKGLSEDKIEEELADIEALGKLDNKSLEAKKFLIKAGEKFIEASKLKTAEAEKTKTDEFTKMLESLDKIEDLSGIKVTKELQTKVKESISKPVYVDGKTGKTYNDIANKQRLYKNEFEKAVNFINVLGLLSFEKDGSWKPDFSKLSSLTTNKMAKKLDEAIAETQRFSKVGGEPSKGSLEQILSQL